MDKHKRKLAKIAAKIHAQIAERHATSRYLDSIDYWARNAERQYKRYCFAANRGFERAANDAFIRHADWVRQIARYAADVSAQLKNYYANETSERITLSAHEIYQELLAIEAQWGPIEFNQYNRSNISITTDCIELEGVELGRFQVHLDWTQLPKARYHVDALDPNPAGGHDGVTHPHVKNEELCEGEAYHDIKSNLKSGFLCEFFDTVNKILHTYNPDSPHIALEDWYSVDCEHCGSTITDEDTACCDECGSDRCRGCIETCPGCDNQFCGSCLSWASRSAEYLCGNCFVSCAKCGYGGRGDAMEQCAETGEALCDRCRDRCEECDEWIDHNLLTDGLCGACTKHQEEDEEDAPPAPATTAV